MKKYPNRRLYNTETSAYVTLKDVGEMIRKGTIVEVLDVKTGDDVTAITLTQIIMEQAKKESSILPVSLLHLIIRAEEDALSEFFEKYLENAIESYLGYKKAMDDQMKLYMGLGFDFSDITESALKKMASFNPYFKKPGAGNKKSDGD